MSSLDTLIIGAGVIGSSVAMHLAEMGVGNITVLDMDLEGSLSSSELNAGGVRATWAQPINIEMAKLSIDYFATHAEQMGYRDCGYLWLHRPETFENALLARERQAAMGWEVQIWDAAKLRDRIPFIDKTEDLAGALFSPRDGLINPNLMKMHFRNRARSLGVRFEDRMLVDEAVVSAQGVKINARRLPLISSETKIEILSGKFDSKSFESVTFQPKRVINCAGAWAPVIARILGYACSSFAVRRQVCIFDGRDVDLTPYGMIVDPSGVYFHSEATHSLAGIANRDEAQGINYTYDGDSFFSDLIWPALYERSSKFEKLKHITGWAGQYEVSPDESAILGEAIGTAPGRVYEAHSFSGHGVMHSHAAGLALAELVVNGKFETLDAGVLSAARFVNGQLLHETAVI